MKKNWNLKSRIITPAISLLFAGFFLFSCSKEAQTSSFMSSLDKVDSYIRLGQTSDALKLLKKTSRQAYSAYARLGIYKRYMILGEKGLAEGVLVKAVKKIPDNPELNAVYGTFLLRDSRIEDALKITKSLANTKYGSIYSEAVLKAQKEKDLLSPALTGVYRDCYISTDNGKWLVNAALPLLKKGDYMTAATLQDKIENSEAVFWAQVHFDAGNYDLCIENLDYAQTKGVSEKNVPLASDAYIMLGDYDSAEKERAKLIERAELEYDGQIPVLTYVNSAIWAYKAGEYERSYNLLMQVVMKDFNNIPSLLTYGKLAFLDSRAEEEDMLEQALRKTPLRSYSMKQKDERPRFLISDAIYRIDSVLEWQKKNSQSVSDELLVEKLALWLKLNSEIPQNKKESEIWKTLELNEIDSDMYPPLLVNFAVTSLLNYGKEEEARTLFSRYLDARYKMKGDSSEINKTAYDVFGGVKKYNAPAVPDFVIKAAFGDRAAEYASTMEIWEIETAAYFTMLDGNIDAARRLYEYALFETGGVKNLQRGEQIVAFSTLAKVSSAVNLASIYSSTGELNRSLSLYGLAGGRTRNKKVKSKILYRTALVQKDLSNINGALLSLDYAISLDGNNAAARLLKKQLK